MDFRLSPAEETFRQEVHDFIDKECPKELRGGGASFFSNAGAYLTWRKKLAEKGWVAPAWPKEYGGAAMTVMEQFVYNMETARMRAPSPIYIGGLGVAVLGPTILVYGSEEQKRSTSPRSSAGEVMWCQGFSEPESGSDLASLQDPRGPRRRRLRHQRAEDLDDAGPHVEVHALPLPRPTRTRRSTRASRTSSSPWTRPASPCGRSSTWPAATSSTRCSSRTCASPPRTSSARRTAAGTWP